MQSVYTRYDRRPEPTAMDFSNHPDIVAAGRSMSVIEIFHQLTEPDKEKPADMISGPRGELARFPVGSTISRRFSPLRTRTQRRQRQLPTKVVYRIQKPRGKCQRKAKHR